MTYDEAMRFIKEAEKLGSIPGLASITKLLERLGNPQSELKIVHVAGTNGKGSTISYISGILAAAGYRVGIYISPVVFSYREKLQIVSSEEQTYNCNNENNNNIIANNISYDKDIPNNDFNDNNSLFYDLISEEDVCKEISSIKAACDEMVKEGQAHPTAFEIETAMAFLYMKNKRVDFLMLETGMGGRLDATNVINNPICSVITSVSLDHMHFLGNTIEQIAIEKAGIMKPNSCVISSLQSPEALKVFHNRAKELAIPIIIADSSQAVNISYSDSFTTFEYPIVNGYGKYKIRMLGGYQVKNAINAITTARCMIGMGYNISEEAIRNGLWLTKWLGRFEQISSEPDIYIDGAHNEDAALALRDSIEIYFTNRRLVFMIGVLADKDYHSMLRILAPIADTIITLTPNNARALTSEILAKEAMAYCSKVFDEKDVEHALERAYKEAGMEDVIFAFGSLTFLGSLRSIVNVRKDDNHD